MSHFCYIVNSTGRDVYADMAFISARFLRTRHPEARITCVADADSASAIRAHGHRLISIVDEVMAIDVPETQPVRQNRWIRTQLRQFVTGDYVYLDSDTLCIRSLNGLFDLARRKSFDVALSRDLNIRFGAKSHRYGTQTLWPELQALGWSSPDSGYFNSGVALSRDTPGSKKLSQCWHALWKLSCNVSGRALDQPALNQAIVASQAKLLVLPAAYNAQVLAAPRTVASAKVMHFYTSVASALSGTVLGNFLTEMKRTGDLSNDSIQRFLADPFPWNTTESFIKYCWGKNRPAALRIALGRLLHGRPCFHPKIAGIATG